jgi:hypothetical protein
MAVETGPAPAAGPIPTPAPADLGANEFTFTGDRTSITFFPVTPGPIVVGHEGGELRYEGPEGSFTFFGKQITRQDSTLGTLLTVGFAHNPDVGGVAVTVLLPRIFGVTRTEPVTFGTLAIKTTGRGFINSPGPALTYTIVPLVGVAKDVILPL